MKPYQPVSCDIHSQYELYIMRATPLFLKYSDSAEKEKSLHAKAIDLRTRQGEEWLLVQASNEKPFSIRLDHIIECLIDTK